MKHKILTLVLSIAVIVSLIFVGCAPEAAPPEEEGVPPEGEAAPPAAELLNEAEKPPEIIPLEMLPAETAEFIALREAIEAEIDALSARMIEMNDWMYYNPESGYMEFECTKMTAAELEKHGFEVKFGVEGLEEGYNAVIEELFDAGGLPTAYVAKYKGRAEHPVIAFVTEHDALRAEPEPFHGCQHNMQPQVALGAAIALSKVMEENNLPGSVWVVMTPAEEIPPPDKAAMAKAGVFDEVDFVFMSHGYSGSGEVKRRKAGISNCCKLINSNLYDFYGKAAHASGNPWDGRDALDAARLFFTGIDMIREHSRDEYRFHSAITETISAPNVINPYVQVDQWIRNADRAGQAALEAKREQVDQIARGAAMATFCDVEIRHYADYYNGIEYAWLNALMWNYINEYGDAEAISMEEGQVGGGWAEAGYPSVNTPGICICPAMAGVPGWPGHSLENAAATITPEGHEALVQMAKISSAVALRLVFDPELRAKVTDEQAQWQAYALEEGLITEDMIRQ